MKRFDLVPLLVRICLYYPDPARLSLKRLMATVFLLDWRSSLIRARQITDIVWKYDHWGPYSVEISDALESRPDIFVIHRAKTLFGDEKNLIGLRRAGKELHYDQETEEIIGFVMGTTCSLGWDQFLDMLYLTYPMSASSCLSDATCDLNLIQLAEQRTVALAFE